MQDHSRSPREGNHQAMRLIKKTAGTVAILCCLLGAASAQGAESPAPVPGRALPVHLVIRDVVACPGGSLPPRGTLVVSATATPGATATFDVGDIAYGLPMAEISAGQYRGIMVTASDMQAPAARVVVHVVLGNLEVFREAPTAVTLVPRTLSPNPWVRVTFPVNEQNVPPVFTLTGQAPVDAEVEVRVTTLRRYVLGLDALEDDGVRTAVGRANGHGNFAIPLDLGVVPRGDTIRIEARSRSQGRQSPWTRYEVLVSDYY